MAEDTVAVTQLAGGLTRFEKGLKVLTWKDVAAGATRGTETPTLETAMAAKLTHADALPTDLDNIALGEQYEVKGSVYELKNQIVGENHQVSAVMSSHALPNGYTFHGYTGTGLGDESNIGTADFNPVTDADRSVHSLVGIGFYTPAARGETASKTRIMRLWLPKALIDAKLTALSQSLEVGVTEVSVITSSSSDSSDLTFTWLGEGETVNGKIYGFGAIRHDQVTDHEFQIFKGFTNGSTLTNYLIGIGALSALATSSNLIYNFSVREKHWQWVESEADTDQGRRVGELENEVATLTTELDAANAHIAELADQIDNLNESVGEVVNRAAFRINTVPGRITAGTFTAGDRLEVLEFLGDVEDDHKLVSIAIWRAAAGETSIPLAIKLNATAEIAKQYQNTLTTGALLEIQLRLVRVRGSTKTTLAMLAEYPGSGHTASSIRNQWNKILQDSNGGTLPPVGTYVSVPADADPNMNFSVDTTVDLIDANLRSGDALKIEVYIGIDQGYASIRYTFAANSSNDPLFSLPAVT